MSKKLKVGKRSGLKYFSYEDIKGWEPCYDPEIYLPVGWRGTTIDILKLEDIPFADRLWCVLRAELISERVMRLFAVWSYRQTLKFITNPDPRSIAAADIAEAYALDKATQEELSAARSAAESAARSAESAARSAWSAWSAAESAARSAAESAARSAWSAAWSAESAARSAVESAARSAVESAAESAARSAVESAQRDKLIEMILVEGKENRKSKK